MEGKGTLTESWSAMNFFPFPSPFEPERPRGSPGQRHKKRIRLRPEKRCLPELLHLGKRRDSPAGWEGAGSGAACIPWELHCRGRTGSGTRVGLGHAWVWGVRGSFGSGSFPGSSYLGREGCLPACLPRGGQEVAVAEDLGSACLALLPAAFTRSQFCHRRLT